MDNHRGYFGIGIYHPKFEENVGGLWRTAHALGASFIFTIGARYKHQPTDTTKADRHIPLFEYDDGEDFFNNRPRDCAIVGIEIDDDAHQLCTFMHPDRAVYLLGAEDTGLQDVYSYCDTLVQIRSDYCLNVATTGSIVMYDRSLRRGR